MSTLSVANDFCGDGGVDLLPVRAATSASGAGSDERLHNASLIVPVDEDSAVAGLTVQEAEADASKKDSLGEEENKETAEEESQNKSQEDQSDDKSGAGNKRFVSRSRGLYYNKRSTRYPRNEFHHDFEDDKLCGNVLR